MKKITLKMYLPDFCYTHGRVIPHGSDSYFTEFHCADRSHDDSDPIYCSEGVGKVQNSMMGILSMSKDFPGDTKRYVVRFEGEDHYLLCTNQEYLHFCEEDRIVREQEEKKTDHPARPNGVKITREIQDASLRAYCKCPDYQTKMLYARSQGMFTPPFILGDNSHLSLICKEDCIFPTCPFYDQRWLSELRHNHRNDYDEWIVGFYKK